MEEWNDVLEPYTEEIAVVNIPEEVIEGNPEGIIEQLDGE